MVLIVGALLFILLPQIAVSWTALTLCSRLYGMKGLLWSFFGVTAFWVVVAVYLSWPCLVPPHLSFLLGDERDAVGVCVGADSLLLGFYAFTIVGLTILGTIIGSAFIAFRMALR